MDAAAAIPSAAAEEGLPPSGIQSRTSVTDIVATLEFEAAQKAEEARLLTAQEAKLEKVQAEEAAVCLPKKAEEARLLAAQKAKLEEMEAEQAAAKKAEEERLAARKAKAERKAAEEVAAKKAEEERLAAQKAKAEEMEAEQAAAKKAEEERLAAQKAKAERPRLSDRAAAAETTGLLGSGGANDGDPAAAVATEPRLLRLLVRQITGEQTALHLCLDDTISALKEALRVEWGIEADAQRLLLANSAAGGDTEAGGGGGGLPLEEDEAATLRACGLADGAELLLTLQDAAQGARRRELREAARREAAERAEAEHKLAEAERVLAAERAELSALRGYARADRRNALKKRPVAGLSEPQREFLSREARRECLRRSAMLVLTLALVALVVYLISIATAPCEDGAHLDGWDRDGCDEVTELNLQQTSVSGDVSGLAPLTQLTYLNL
eukprot:COSAG06_NODE_2770_length_6314_cov_1.878681_2_plen_442_part_00